MTLLDYKIIDGKESFLRLKNNWEIITSFCTEFLFSMQWQLHDNINIAILTWKQWNEHRVFMIVWMVLYKEGISGKPVAVEI